MTTGKCATPMGPNVLIIHFCYKHFTPTGLDIESPILHKNINPKGLDILNQIIESPILYKHVIQRG
jgi:hypothetical protein